MPTQFEVFLFIEFYRIPNVAEVCEYQLWMIFIAFQDNLVGSWRLEVCINCEDKKIVCLLIRQTFVDLLVRLAQLFCSESKFGYPESVGQIYFEFHFIRRIKLIRKCLMRLTWLRFLDAES